MTQLAADRCERCASPTNQEFLTAEELCSLLRVKRSWVYDAVEQLNLPVYRFGRLLRFDKREVLDWARNRT